jgi:hypothetical protein
MPNLWSPGRDSTRIAIAAAIATALATFWIFRGLRHDDAYITFQFARNVGSGRGFVFNAGERVLGSTSPLHVLVLAAVYAVLGDVIARAAVLIGAIAMAAQSVLLFLIFKRTSVALGSLLALLMSLGYFGSHSWLALETNLLAALVLGVFWSLEARREILCGVLLGLAFLCRYDAGLLVPICLLVWWSRSRAVPYRMLLAAFLVVLPWLGWATLYFGSFMPHTFFVKQRITRPIVYFAAALTRFSESPWKTVPESARPLLALTTPLFWAAGAIFVWRHARQAVALCLYGAALVVAYSWIAPHPAQHWHLYVAEMAFTLLFLLGSVGWLLRLYDSNVRDAALVRALPAAIASLLLIVSTGLSTAAFGRSHLTDYWLGRRHDRYVESAAWLRSHVPADRVVLAPEVGTLGYLTGMRMVDPYGLINATNGYPKAPSIENLAALVDWYHPDVLLLDTPDQGAFFERRSQYRIVKVFDDDPWSTVLVRTPGVLLEPSTFDALLTQLPPRAHAALDSGTR